jgi:hypothetical protein
VGFENRVLRKIFGPKREKITREWQRLHNGAIHELYSSPHIIGGDQIKKNEIGGACGKYAGEENCIQRFGGETWGK